jgi:hypothetical protein
VSGHHLTVFGEWAKSRFQTDMKKKENMAVLLQRHGLEKLDMFNIFAKLRIFSFLGV